MDLFKALKQLQKIESDEAFKKTSLNLILGARQTSVKPGVWGVILKNLELGASLALAGLLIFMIVGGFSAWKIFAPLQVANLDQATLRAEAQAIDIQIKLASLNYETTAAAGASLGAAPLPAASDDASAPEVDAVNQPAGGDANATSSDLSIDEALRALSE